MKRLRYFTETLLEDEDPHNHLTQKSAALLGDGSWVRISPTTIVGIAELAEHQFSFFQQDHPSVVILPSLHEKTSIKDHLTKVNKGRHIGHLDALNKHCGVVSSDTTADVVSKLMQKGHTFLSPDK